MRIFVVHIFFLFFSGVYSTDLYAQPLRYESSTIHLRAKYGFLIPHRIQMHHLLQGHSKAIEVDYEMQTYGSKAWHEAYRFPFTGVLLSLYDYGNPQVLGQTVSVIPYMNFHLYRKENFGANFRVGFGGSYTTKKFDKIDNYKNVAIGSHFNVAISFMFSVRRTWERFTLSAGIEALHCSNGAVNLPNLGVNVPTLSLGLGYRLEKEKKEIQVQKHADQTSKKWSYQILGIATVKQEYPIGTGYFGVTSLGLSGQRMFNLKSGFSARLDLINNLSHLRYVKDTNKSNFSQIWQAGVSAHYLMSLEHLKFLMGMGVYIKNTLNPDGPFYHRLALQYQWSSGLIANIGIKAHFGRADYAEFGIGYTFIR